MDEQDRRSEPLRANAKRILQCKGPLIDCLISVKDEKNERGNAGRLDVWGLGGVGYELWRERWRFGGKHC